jgi:hypothetical protein
MVWDTNWHKNFLANQTLKISLNDQQISATGEPITDALSSHFRNITRT